METPITVRYRWTADELIASYVVYHRRFIFTPFHIAFYLIILSMIVFTTVNLSVHNWFRSAIFLPFFLILPFRGLINRMLWRRGFNKRPDKDVDIEIQFSPDKMTSNTLLGHSEAIWDAVYEVVQAKDGFLLFITPQIFSWLPRHGFASDEGYQAFAELARQKVKRYREVRNWWESKRSGY